MVGHRKILATDFVEGGGLFKGAVREASEQGREDAC